MIRSLALVLAAAALLAGCKSPEEKLFDRRAALRELLDGLYAEYGGSDLAKETRRGEGGEGRGGGVVGRLMGEMDRAHFEETCLASGRGERTFVLSERLDVFLRERAHADACRKAARLDAEVARLERDAGARSETSRP